MKNEELFGGGDHGETVEGEKRGEERNIQYPIFNVQCSREEESFPHNGKLFRDFSTQWKECLHSVEK